MDFPRRLPRHRIAHADIVKPADAKLQRWIDLVAALLSHRFGITFAELKSLVPAYGGSKSAATVARMFERDKDELRALGIPIRVREEDSDEGMVQRYSVRAPEMYLPYLALASHPRGTGKSAPTRVPPAGYRELPTLAFDPDELSLLVRAAQCARAVGEPALERDASSAIAKLTHDLALAFGSVAMESIDALPPHADREVAPAVTTLGEALLRRKRVSFVYRSLSRDATEPREVEPFGLSFTSGHWYLIGRDVGGDVVRKFRVSRIAELRVNASRPQSADYELPNGFDLATEARLKESWELGDDVAEEMIVEIVGETGAASSVRGMGAPVVGMPNQRCFHVRRLDSFVRWLMSFAGEVVPMSPARLIDAYHETVNATLSAYASGAMKSDA